MGNKEVKKGSIFDEIDMDDPTTKQFYDCLTEEGKKNFPEAYVHLKHYKAWMSITNNAWYPEKPLTKVAQDFIDKHPEILELGKKSAAALLELGKEGPGKSPVHAKVSLYKDAKKLLTQGVEVNVEVEKKVLPLEKTMRIILDNPTSIAVGKCPCRMVQPEPCKIVPYPYDMCLAVGDGVAQFAAEHSDLDFELISVEKALEILENNHKMGLVANPLWREIYGGRFYAICCCCDCCCIGVQAHNKCIQANQPSWIMSPSGYIAEIGDECNGCGICVKKCQFYAIELNEDKRAVIDFDKCMGCGACEVSCPVEAVTMRVEPSKGEILDMDEICKDTKM